MAIEARIKKLKPEIDYIEIRPDMGVILGIFIPGSPTREKGVFKRGITLEPAGTEDLDYLEKLRLAQKVLKRLEKEEVDRQKARIKARLLDEFEDDSGECWDYPGSPYESDYE